MPIKSDLKILQPTRQPSELEKRSLEIQEAALKLQELSLKEKQLSNAAKVKEKEDESSVLVDTESNNWFRYA